MSLTSVIPVQHVPTGIDRLGFPTYGALPGGVPNPPNAFVEAQELAVVRELNARTAQNGDASTFTTYLGNEGGRGIWRDFAKQYRHTAGFARGWIGTGMVYAAMGAASLRSRIASAGYARLHPFEVDPTIQPIGSIRSKRSYPSRTASTAWAAATVLARLWPARAAEFGWWAEQVGMSRVHAGENFPSDVRMGAMLGVRAGVAAASLLN